MTQEYLHFQQEETLNDNSFYYWRVKANDGVYNSEWMDTANFFVNTSNDRPSVPRISWPQDKSEGTN